MSIDRAVLFSARQYSFCILLLIGAAQTAFTQSPEQEIKDSVVAEAPQWKPAASPATDTPSPPGLNDGSSVEKLERRFFIHLAGDQKSIWTSPFRISLKDGLWLVPAGAITGEIIHRDAYLYGRLRVGSEVQSRRFSDAGVLALGGAVGGAYLFGRIKSSDRARETGVLGAQALINSILVNSALKYSLGRERPFAGDGKGAFFNPGSESFPSAHAMHAWSMASVLAHEYPGVVTKVAVYGLATGVSLARVTGRKHFPSDVVVGSVLGYLIGKSVYQRHRDPKLTDWDPRSGASEPLRYSERSSPFVPLDSWIYPAIDRLASWGLARSEFSGIRPWTRLECARLTNETLQELSSIEPGQWNDEAELVHRQLLLEFHEELGILEGAEEAGTVRFRLQDIYARVAVSSGEPLNDGFHFGQTLVNDYGRPFRQGFNSVSGLTVNGDYGHWSAQVQAEFQHAPSADGYSLNARSQISAVDGVPLLPGTPFKETNRVRLLDSYISFQRKSWQVSVGKQSLWWAPNHTGALSFSNNADPVFMVRVSRVHPMVLPGVLGMVGPIRGEIFFGRLAGHNYTRTTRGLFGPNLEPPPFLQGGKLSFKPTPNLELGFSITAIWGGEGTPVNLRSFVRSLGISNTIPGQPSDPGDRRSGFDFKYRVPGLRNWLTLYNDSMTEDEFSPLGYPRRSAMNPGIYLSRFPKAAKLDLRAEGVYTDLPNLRPIGFYYHNDHYLNGFTNNGNILGHWIGRMGSGVQLSSSYWLSPEKRFFVGFRKMQTNSKFIGGGELSDLQFGADWTLRKVFSITSKIQYERWRYPVLAPGFKSNTYMDLQLKFRPNMLAKGKIPI